MTKIGSNENYDFYMGMHSVNDKRPVYNIVLKNSPKPEGGYLNKSYIEKIKNVVFP